MQLALQVLDDISESALLCSGSQFSPAVRTFELQLEFFVLGLELRILMLEVEHFVVVVADFSFVEGECSL
jgi:hypothetical protein